MNQQVTFLPHVDQWAKRVETAAAYQRKHGKPNAKPTDFVRIVRVKTQSTNTRILPFRVEIIYPDVRGQPLHTCTLLQCGSLAHRCEWSGGWFADEGSPHKPVLRFGMPSGLEEYTRKGWLWLADGINAKVKALFPKQRLQDVIGRGKAPAGKLVKLEPEKAKAPIVSWPGKAMVPPPKDSPVFALCHSQAEVDTAMAQQKKPVRAAGLAKFMSWEPDQKDDSGTPWPEDVPDEDRFVERDAEHFKQFGCRSCYATFNFSKVFKSDDLRGVSPWLATVYYITRRTDGKPQVTKRTGDSAAAAALRAALAAGEDATEGVEAAGQGAVDGAEEEPEAGGADVAADGAEYAEEEEEAGDEGEGEGGADGEGEGDVDMEGEDGAEGEDAEEGGEDADEEAGDDVEGEGDDAEGEGDGEEAGEDAEGEDDGEEAGEDAEGEDEEAVDGEEGGDGGEEEANGAEDGGAEEDEAEAGGEEAEEGVAEDDGMADADDVLAELGDAATAAAEEDPAPAPAPAPKKKTVAKKPAAVSKKPTAKKPAPTATAKKPAPAAAAKKPAPAAAAKKPPAKKSAGAPAKKPAVGAKKLPAKK